MTASGIGRSTPSGSAPCWDCDHDVAQHSGEYEGWDRRSPEFVPVKQPGTGCLVDGCTCRRWFEEHPS
jgi:hypothetical protein